MPVVQDLFPTDYALGFPGMVANGETSNRITRTIEDAAGIPFGAPVFLGATAHGCIKAVAGGPTKFLGIVIVDHGQVILPAGVADAYPQYHNVPILQRGSVWVLVGTLPVLRGDLVYALNADSSYVNVATSATLLPGWVFDDAGAAGAMVRITNNRHAAV